MSNPFEGSYDQTNPNDVMRQARDEAWNVHTANEDYDQAIEQLQGSLDTPLADTREINQTLGYEARVQWLRGEDDLAVDGMRTVLSDMRANRRLDTDHHNKRKRDQYEDINLPWSAVIESTSVSGSRLRGLGQAALAVVYAPVSQDPRFRREVDPDIDRTAEVKGRLKKSAGALAVAGLALVSRTKARKLARDNFVPQPSMTAEAHGLRDQAGQ